MTDIEIAYQQIRERIEAKHLAKKAKRVRTGRLPRSGHNKDHQLHAVMETFGLCKATLQNYRVGRFDQKKKRLYVLLRALPIELLNELQGMEL